MSQQLVMAALLLAVVTPVFSLSTVPSQIITITATNTIAASVTITQGFGAIQGTVLGQNLFSNYEPLVWAKVNASNGQENFVTYSGGGGLYELNLPVGSYDVTVSQPGYCLASAIVTISKGALVTANFKLDQSTTLTGCLTGVSAITSSSYYSSTRTVTATSVIVSTKSTTTTPEFPSDGILNLVALVVVVSFLVALRKRR